MDLPAGIRTQSLRRASGIVAKRNVRRDDSHAAGSRNRDCCLTLPLKVRGFRLPPAPFAELTLGPFWSRPESGVPSGIVKWFNPTNYGLIRKAVAKDVFVQISAVEASAARKI